MHTTCGCFVAVVGVRIYIKHGWFFLVEVGRRQVGGMVTARFLVFGLGYFWVFEMRWALLGLSLFFWFGLLVYLMYPIFGWFLISYSWSFFCREKKNKTKCIHMEGENHKFVEEIQRDNAC